MKIDDINTIYNKRLLHGCTQIFLYMKRTSMSNKAKKLFIAEYDSDVDWYTTLKPQALTGPFAKQVVPEVSDFNMFPQCRCRGIGSNKSYNLNE